jgi:hypothetical protein
LDAEKRSPMEYKEPALRTNIFATHAWPHVILGGGRIYCRDREGHLV